MPEAELFQLVVVDALRDFDAGEVLPLECIGQGGKNFQRRQSPAKGGRDAVQNAGVAVPAEDPVGTVIAVGPELAVGKALLQCGSTGGDVSCCFVQGSKLLVDQRGLPFGRVFDVLQQCVFIFCVHFLVKTSDFMV